jgi:hypothetical protein
MKSRRRQRRARQAMKEEHVVNTAKAKGKKGNEGRGCGQKDKSKRHCKGQSKGQKRRATQSTARRAKQKAKQRAQQRARQRAREVNVGSGGT